MRVENQIRALARSLLPGATSEEGRSSARAPNFEVDLTTTYVPQIGDRGADYVTALLTAKAYVAATPLRPAMVWGFEVRADRPTYDESLLAVREILEKYVLAQRAVLNEALATLGSAEESSPVPNVEQP